MRFQVLTAASMKFGVFWTSFIICFFVNICGHLNAPLLFTQQYLAIYSFVTRIFHAACPKYSIYIQFC
jgi:hypothetical protein